MKSTSNPCTSRLSLILLITSILASPSMSSDPVDEACGQNCLQSSEMSRCLRMTCRRYAMGSLLRFGKRGKGGATKLNGADLVGAALSGIQTRGQELLLQRLLQQRQEAKIRQLSSSRSPARPWQDHQNMERFEKHQLQGLAGTESTKLASNDQFSSLWSPVELEANILDEAGRSGGGSSGSGSRSPVDDGSTSPGSMDVNSSLYSQQTQHYQNHPQGRSHIGSAKLLSRWLANAMKSTRHRRLEQQNRRLQRLTATTNTQNSGFTDSYLNNYPENLAPFPQSLEFSDEDGLALAPKSQSAGLKPLSNNKLALGQSSVTSRNPWTLPYRDYFSAQKKSLTAMSKRKKYLQNIKGTRRPGDVMRLLIRFG